MLRYLFIVFCLSLVAPVLAADDSLGLMLAPSLFSQPKKDFNIPKAASSMSREAAAEAANAAKVDGENEAMMDAVKGKPTGSSRTGSTVHTPRVPPAQAVPAVQPMGDFDYSVNRGSDVFGAQLFTGVFARQGTTQFNPNYVVAIGDSVQIRLWGAFELDSVFVVDAKGNIFLPQIGPMKVAGVRNQDLQSTVEQAVRKMFTSNVFSYASLVAAQPVRIFVSGYVHRPGLYNGTSMDSLLHYLDQAGGVDPERGSFLEVQVKRDNKTRARVNLYDFLLKGTTPLVQLADGDVIFVTSRKNVVRVAGYVENAKRFEFASQVMQVSGLMELAKPMAHATHVRVIRNTGTVQNVEYYALEQAGEVFLRHGDEVEFTADKRPGTITVRVEGEHLSPQEYVLPHGARMGDLTRQIQFTDRSDVASLQLFRLSVKESQRAMLQTALRSLETAALTARSATSDEAMLRKEEADLILQWVKRAKNVEPSGQVYIAQASTRDTLLLENGDILRVPIFDGLVIVNGEVLFPNAIAYDTSLNLSDYIRHAGGYTQNADAARIIIAHRDGSFDEATGEGGFSSFLRSGASVRTGDKILVLPKIDVKSMQITKDLTQILYQIAVSSKIAFGL